MTTGYERRKGERGVSIKDLDRFSDLRWEDEIRQHASTSQARHRNPVNLTAKIEDYLRNHF